MRIVYCNIKGEEEKMSDVCKFGHVFDGESPFCAKCGVRLMADEHVAFNRKQMERKLNESPY